MINDVDSFLLDKICFSSACKGSPFLESGLFKWALPVLGGRYNRLPGWFEALFCVGDFFF